MTATILKGGLLIDGTGAAPIPNSVLRMDDGKITARGSVSDFGESGFHNADIIDATGRTVMPGLINCHEHLDLHYSFGSWESRLQQGTYYWVSRAARNALIALCDGVTTVRDLASWDGNNYQVKRAIKDGIILGPRVITCGQPIAMTGGHGWQECIVADGPDQVRKAARHILNSGADLIKCMSSGDFMVRYIDQPRWPQMTVEELRAAIEESHDQEKPTTVHCHPPEGIRRSIEAGVDCIEHGALLDEPTAKLMAQKGVYLVPTLGETFVIAERGEILGKPRWIIEDAKAFSDERWKTFRYALEAGVKIAVGTDTCDSVYDELELMMEADVNAMDALVAATRTGAEVCGIADRTGTLVEGKWADVLVLDGNPLQDLSALTRVEMVFKDGTRYIPHELRPAIGTFPL